MLCHNYRHTLNIGGLPTTGRSLGNQLPIPWLVESIVPVLGVCREEVSRRQSKSVSLTPRPHQLICAQAPSSLQRGRHLRLAPIAR